MINKLLPLLLLVALSVLGATAFVATRGNPELEIYDGENAPSPGDLHKRTSGVPGDRDDPLETIRTLTNLQEQTLRQSEEDRKKNEEMRNTIDSRIAEGISQKVQTEMEEMKTAIAKATGEVDQKYKRQIESMEKELARAKALIEKNAKTARQKLPTLPEKTSTTVASIADSTLTDFGFDKLEHGSLPINQGTPKPSRNAYVSIRPMGFPDPNAVEGESGGLTNPLAGAGGLLDVVPNSIQNNSLNVNRNPSRTRQSLLNSGTPNGSGVLNQSPPEPQVIPRFTIPDGSTLYSNTTMTAMIGVVPLNGTVSEPFRFKIITGGENLAASKHLLPPDLSHIIWTGYTIGNRAQSCVSGYLDTVTMVFDDGTISTTTNKTVERRQSATNNFLAYITDEFGKPCITGQLYDNGTEFLSSRVGIAALAAAANGASLAETETSRGNSRDTTSLTGDVGAFIAGQTVAGAAEELLDFAIERATDSVDLVFIPTGVFVSIHVESQIEFDQDRAGRKLVHATNTGQGGTSLD